VRCGVCCSVWCIELTHLNVDKEEASKVCCVVCCIALCGVLCNL